MRFLCSAIDGNDVEGEVIGGEDFDPITGTCDLDAMFTVRCDDGHSSGSTPGQWTLRCLSLGASQSCERCEEKTIHRARCCPCGREKILAPGLCATCYTLKRQDEEYFGGHREEVLARDGYRCRIPGCGKSDPAPSGLRPRHSKAGKVRPPRCPGCTLQRR